MSIRGTAVYDRLSQRLGTTPSARFFLLHLHRTPGLAFSWTGRPSFQTQGDQAPVSWRGGSRGVVLVRMGDENVSQIARARGHGGRGNGIIKSSRREVEQTAISYNHTIPLGGQSMHPKVYTSTATLTPT